ncbi:TIGR02186 family protein [Ferrovibrio sp.]|uniref:TIGR02186 family protein n=1 Tax=Ferrovibrio sp. TaxID=1917215 RepID=UPI00311F337B
MTGGGRILLLLGLLLAMPAAALAQQGRAAATRGPAPADAPLITDLSAHLIAITSSFTGTDLLLFGAIDEPGDIVVVVRGPTSAAVVRRKEPIAGLWLTRRSASFDGVPGFYVVTSSRPLAEIAPSTLLSRLQIGIDSLRFRFTGSGIIEDLPDFRDALIRQKRREGLYQQSVGDVDFLGPKLFRTAISFPATAPVGTYQAEVYLIRDERIIAAQSTPLFIDKQGFEQEVYEFSRAEPAVYGLIAVLVAMLSGWLAAVVFRKN